MIEDFEEFLLDSKLNIHTTGRNDKHADQHRYPYEATAYVVLERLAEAGLLSSEDVLLDYGCGKGRVPIYFHYKVGCKGFGVEMMKEFYKNALENQKGYAGGNDICFVNTKAESYEVPEEVNSFFFFNPFDIGIFRGVMKKILQSYDKAPRKMKFFFYYPQDEYIHFLENETDLILNREIDCKDLFAGEENRSRLLIYELN